MGVVVVECINGYIENYFLCSIAKVYEYYHSRYAKTPELETSNIIYFWGGVGGIRGFILRKRVGHSVFCDFCCFSNSTWSNDQTMLSG